MFFVTVLSLVAVALARPDWNEQKEVEQYNTIPLYKQQFYPYSMTNLYGNIRNNRYFPHYGQMKEVNSFLPYYKDLTYRDYFLRSLKKPETSVMPKQFDYDSQDMYHFHDINHHYKINNFHNFQENNLIRKVENFEKIPQYSPYMNMLNLYKGGYPYVNHHYAKSIEQDYVQPWYNNYYNKFWDTDYVRNYYNRNLDYPIAARSLEIEDSKPNIANYDEVLVHENPIVSKNLDFDYNQPKDISKNVNFENLKPILSKNVDAEYVQPIVSKYLDLNYYQPQVRSVVYEFWPYRGNQGLAKNLRLNYITPTNNY